MNLRNAFLLVSCAVLCLVNAACGQTQTAQQPAPKVTISLTRVPAKAHIDVQGTGFTPKHNISSHLRKADGTEFPVLPIVTDDHGGFTHDIDTLLLAVGKHQLWVVDDATNVSSNVAEFEVTRDQPLQNTAK